MKAKRDTRSFLTYCLFLLIFNFGSIRDCESQNILVPYAWRDVDYLYPSETERAEAISNGSFAPSNVVVNDVDAWPGELRNDNAAQQRIFVTTPRVAPGIPATLSTITNIRNNESFLLSPFPNWESQIVDEECNGLVSVDKIHIDKCGLLWITDTSVTNLFTGPRRVCTPKLLIYDLKNGDTLVDRYEFPTGVYLDRSSLTTTVTDSRTDTCRDSIAYISDLNAYGLVVFDMSQRTSWRVNHNYFFPNPLNGFFTIAGASFDLMDGVFGLALGPIQTSGDRLLYFHSMASLRESWVPTSVLKNTTLITNRTAIRHLFTISPEFREGQCTLEVMTESGILIYADVIRNAIVCWNTATPPLRSNTQVIYQHDEHLQFISGLKLKSDTLWIATNRIQNIFSPSNATNARNEFRMRILVVKSISELLQGTRCVSSGPSSRSPGLPPPSPPNRFGGRPY